MRVRHAQGGDSIPKFAGYPKCLTLTDTMVEPLFDSESYLGFIAVVRGAIKWR